MALPVAGATTSTFAKTHMIRALSIALIIIGRASADDSLEDIMRQEEPPLLGVLRGDEPERPLNDDKSKVAFQMHLREVKNRMKVECSDSGNEGTVFRVWIDPPQKPSFDAKKFEGLSPFAQVVDVPCEEVVIWLIAYGPNGADLRFSVGFRRFDRTGGIFLEFQLPKSHSGQENKVPSLVLMCSNIQRADGNFVDFISTWLALMEPTVPKEQQSKDKDAITK